MRSDLTPPKAGRLPLRPLDPNPQDSKPHGKALVEGVLARLNTDYEEAEHAVLAIGRSRRRIPGAGRPTFTVSNLFSGLDLSEATFDAEYIASTYQ